MGTVAALAFLVLSGLAAVAAIAYLVSATVNIEQGSNRLDVILVIVTVMLVMVAALLVLDGARL